MGDLLVGILLFIAIVVGWLLGKVERKKTSNRENCPSGVGKEYFDGLNLLLNEKPDEAVDLLLNTLDVNGDTFETYLVMGGLFRRRGEVERSIQIHQDMLARSDMSKQQHHTVKLELARDYLSAGVLDRAERLLKEIADDGAPNQIQALEHLLTIFEQEKEWSDAIRTAKKLVERDQHEVRPLLAHLYCERAKHHLSVGDFMPCRRDLKKALQADKYCVRANFILAEAEIQSDHAADAILALKKILEQDPTFVPDTIASLRRCYQALGQMSEYSKYLFQCLERSPAISIVIELSELVSKLEGQEAGEYILSEYLKKRPSVKGLDRLISTQMAHAQGLEKDNLGILQAFTQRLIKDKPVYRCNGCGFNGKTLHWQCPSCKSWGKIRPIQGLEGE